MNIVEAKNVRDIYLGVVCPMAREGLMAAQFASDVIASCEALGFDRITFFAVLDKATEETTHRSLKDLALQRPQLEIICSPEDRHVVDAYIRGYREALAAGCDWILEIDAGYSHRPSEIPQFVEKMSDGYDCVFGSRFIEGGSMEGAFDRRLISWGGTLLTNVLLGTKLRDMTSGFEMFNADSLRYILDKGIESSGHFFQTEIKVHVRDRRITEVPITYCVTSGALGRSVLKDSLTQLWRLFRLRLAGKL